MQAVLQIVIAAPIKAMFATMGSVKGVMVLLVDLMLIVHKEGAINATVEAVLQVG